MFAMLCRLRLEQSAGAFRWVQRLTHRIPLHHLPTVRIFPSTWIIFKRENKRKRYLVKPMAFHHWRSKPDLSNSQQKKSRLIELIRLERLRGAMDKQRTAPQDSGVRLKSNRVPFGPSTLPLRLFM